MTMQRICVPIKKLLIAAKKYMDEKHSTGIPFEKMPELRHLHKDVQQYKVAKYRFTENKALKMHERADWTGVQPELREFYNALYKALRARDFPVYCHSGWRSPQLQKKLFLEGHSTLKSGPHQRGAAIDVVHLDYHWSMSENAWLYVGLIGENIIRQRSLSIRWGGRWKNFWDPAHWELKNWRNLPEVPEHHEKERQMPAGILSARITCKDPFEGHGDLQHDLEWPNVQS